MKKNDIIVKAEHIPKGEVLAHGFEDIVQAKRWAHENGEPSEIVEDNGEYKVMCGYPFDREIRAKVNWVVDDEMGLSYLESGNCGIEETTGWKVVQEATPSYQSSVADMSEDQLRESLEALRSKRKKAPKTKQSTRRSGSREPQSKLQKALEGLSAEKKKKLMEKLGLA